MRRIPWALSGIIVILPCLLLLLSHSVQGQQILQNGFEGRNTSWKAGSTDAAVKVLEHNLTEETAHDGQRCEHIKVEVEKGTFIHYTLDIPRAAISEDLSLRLWVKSNRPGIQLLCRMVLPRERDPNIAGKPLSVLVRCDPYQSTRWKALGLLEPVKRLREQQQLLNHRLGRDVITTGAYIDQLVLNVCDGSGQIDVWIDDLEVGPVDDTRPVLPAETPIARPGAGPGRPVARRNAEVQVRANQLWVNGKRFFLRGIRHTGAPPLKVLRDAGFNTVWLDESTPPNLVEDAGDRGFWIVPTIAPPRIMAGGGGGVEGTLTSRDDFAQKVSRFAEHESVLAWDLGSNLGAERFSDVARLARAFRAADPTRPVMADIWDGYRGYSRSLEQLMVGTHRWPLMTSMELPAYRDWLNMRRRLSTDGYCWTWVQTHQPDWFLKMQEQDRPVGNIARGVAGEGPNTGAVYKEPIGPMPEQIRLLAYTAIAAGYRGLAFWSDRYLADTHQGKDRLLGMALLNQELSMLERLLVNATMDPGCIPTSHPEVKAAIFRTEGGGVLVLPIWMGPGAQFVPGQGACEELTVTVPGVPITATAWEVSPGRIQAYRVYRKVGGSTVKIRNFSLTTAIVFTSDLSPSGLIVRLQDQQRRIAGLAAQWLCEQAQEEMKKIEAVSAELDRLGHGQPDAAGLLKKAHAALDRCLEHRRNREHGEAYGQAEVALRSLRVLARAHWESAIRDFDTPVASPYAVSLYTLPRHWQMVKRIKDSRLGKSVLPDGDFEIDPRSPQPGWLVQEIPTLDDVEFQVERVKVPSQKGSQSLMIHIRAKDPAREPAGLERTYVALHSPQVKLEPGSLVRVSAWVRVPAPIRASVDGALLFDTAGGEPLGIRLTAATGDKWKKFSLYRRVPASGAIGVTMAMSGLGTVYFDDVRIEPLVAGR